MSKEYKSRRERKRGGATPVHEVGDGKNVPGHEDNDIEPALLKRGGKVREHLEGNKARHHLAKRKRGGGIHIKASHKGLLHRDLGVPEGKPIPAGKMEEAKAHASPAEKKRIVFAENARKWNH